MMNLSNLNKPALKNKKRRGKGSGSGLGKTGGRGYNGQKSRSGGNIPAWFEGGQMPLQRRLPKRGFTSINRKEYRIINLGALVALGEADITVATMEEKGLIPKKLLPVKVLASGVEDFKAVLNVEANKFSANAKKLIESCGGSVKEI